MAVKYPAELFSRSIPKKIFKKVFAADDSFFGSPEIRVPLVRAGFQDKFIVKLSGGFTVANAPVVLTPRGAFNLAKRVTFEPQGYQKMIDCDGWGLHQIKKVTSAFTPHADGFERTPEGLDASTGANVKKSTFPLALGAQTYAIYLEVPFTRSAFDPTGALYIPQPSNTELVILPAAVKTEIVTVAANLTVFGCTVEVWQVVFSRPPSDDTVIPFGRGKAVVNTIEMRSADVTVAGDNEIVFPRGGQLLDSLHLVVVNGVADTADIQSLTLDFDGVKIYDTVDEEIFDYITQRKNRNLALPLGVIHLGQDELRDSDGAAYKVVPPDGPDNDKIARSLEPSKGRWLYLDSVQDKAKLVITLAAGAGVVATDRIYSYFRRQRVIEVGV